MQRQPLAVPTDIKRYFVSPAESGEICMLASILGVSGDIFFPKLNEDQLTSFYDITSSFLKEIGYEMDVCYTEEEAREKASGIDTTNKYPVYAFNSDTTGEKLYEEFYTSSEIVDWNTYESLAVAKGSISNTGGNVNEAVNALRNVFKSEIISKGDIIKILKSQIPNFGHIEKGVTLDNKM
jgi:FlaA1/EpsC-like NDP-sugar epimerase